MKIAIVGAGVSGLSCALECERLGVVPDIYERDSSIGWIWPSVIFWPGVFTKEQAEIRNYLLNKFNIDVRPLSKTKSFIMKSANQEVKVEGKLGYFLARGKAENSFVKQMQKDIMRTRIQYNVPADYKELAKEYDYVVVSSGKVDEALDLGVWESLGTVYMMGGVALGNFDKTSSTVFFNTDYAGTGYARITPFNSYQAIVGIYTIGKEEYEVDKLFKKFLEMENLNHLDFIYKLTPPSFQLGRVRKFQVDNVFLAGRAAGLTERLLGVGGPEAIMSGVYAARSVIQGEDYTKLMKPLKKHVENVSAFRDIVNKFENKDFDRMLSVLGTPGVKQAIYNTNMNFVDAIGKVLKFFNK
ncbi:NAD(P)/FAD-dependent oxidoreductase [Sporosalibacterium faouarense]|uniref:NAD(P)/FAD-dependent oxidoreductase n=1 Tax=Sporosalibacterium faouarense TaxID=516123 RepID=UPI00192C4235|nr:NAD(P)-binding protein [Sporosalibacterium faouarense]